MALISRYNVLSCSLGRRMGGTTQSGDRANFGKNGTARNRFQAFARFNATPSGYVAPYSWVPAQTDGGMASFTRITADGELAGSLSGGKNAEASLTATMTLTPPAMGLIVALAASITATGTLAPPTLSGVLFAAAALSASGTLNAPTMGAIVSAVAALSASGTLAAEPHAIGHLEADISNVADADVPTADQNAQAVMSYVLENGLDVAAVLRILLSMPAGAGTVPPGDGDYEFLAQDGSTVRVAGSVTGGVRTVDTVNGDP